MISRDEAMSSFVAQLSPDMVMRPTCRYCLEHFEQNLQLALLVPMLLDASQPSEDLACSTIIGWPIKKNLEVSGLQANTQL